MKKPKDVLRNDALQRNARKLLASSHLLQLLGRYGDVELVGSYQVGLMTHEDIDLHISRKKAFTQAEILEIQKCIAAKRSFTSSGYYFSSWRKKSATLPHGYYLGFRTVYRGQTWTIDMWFMSDAEKATRRHERIDMRNVELTITQKVVMMRCKRYLGKHGIKVWGQKVYEAVLLDGVTTISGFKEWVAQNAK